MISEKIKELRELAGYSQAQLAKKLDVTRSSVNAWEMGLSTPTTQYIVAYVSFSTFPQTVFSERNPA